MFDILFVNLLMFGIFLLVILFLSGYFYVRHTKPIVINFVDNRNISNAWKLIKYKIVLSACKAADIILRYSLFFIVIGMLCIFIALILAHYYIAVIIIIVLLAIFINWLFKNICNGC